MVANKATKKMARKGQLKNAIHARRKFKRISGRRQPDKGSRATNIVKAGAEFRSESGGKKKKKGAFDDMDAEEFLQGGFEEEDTDGIDDDDVDVLEGSDEGDDDLSDLSGGDGSDDDEEEDNDEGDGDGGGKEGLSDGSEEEINGEEDEEEEEGPAADPVVKDNRRLRGEIAKHKAQLEALREKDPEFYEYLKEADAELLGFGVGEDDDDDEGVDDEEDDDEDDEEEEGGRKKTSKQQVKDPAAAKEKKKGAVAERQDEEDDADKQEEPGTSGRLYVTSAIASRWIDAARGGPEGKGLPALGSFGFLVRAYRLACHYGDLHDILDSGKLRITSSAVYNSIMMFMLKEADGIIRRLLSLPAAGENEGPLPDVAKNSRWRKVGPLAKSFWGNSIHLLGTITDAPLLAFTLRRLRASVFLLSPFPRLKDRFLRACLGVFGTGEVAPRLQAFLAIRAMAVSLPQPALDSCLKGVYRTFISNSKFVSAASAPHIAFMATCLVDLWGIDMEASYQHAFIAVRQLAQLMRTALTSKTTDSYKAVYCWQTVNCLELWAKVLGAHNDKPQLRPLVYPVVQLLLGAARLVPTPRYFPLRLRLARALNKLAAQASVYVPVAPLALEALSWGDLRRPPGGGGSGGGGKGKGAAMMVGCPDLSLQLKLGKQLMRSAACQEEVVTQVLELLSDHLATWSCSVAFPELAHVPQLHLRKFIKGCNVDRFRRAAKQLLDAVQRNVTWVGAARDRVDFGPKDQAKVQAFLRDEREAGRSPLQQLAAAMAARAAQRAAARRAEEVDLGGGSRKRSRKDSSEDEGADGDDAAAANCDSGTEDDEDGKATAGTNSKRQKKDAVAANGREYVGTEEDVFEDYLPSEDSEEDDVIEGDSGSEDEDVDDVGGDSDGGSDDGIGDRGPLDSDISDDDDDDDDDGEGDDD
ncbi:hypothetical protein VaNZ11_004935, partial [Volvox africanus]